MSDRVAQAYLDLIVTLFSRHVETSTLTHTEVDRPVRSLFKRKEWQTTLRY